MKYLKSLLLCVAAIVGWSALALWLALAGVWMDPIAEPEKDADFFAWAAAELDSQTPGAAALVLIEAGKVVGQHFSGDVNEDTLFPTASFSKWVTAFCVMTLVEQGRLDPDLPVATYLTRWQLPASEFDRDAVTVRRLLSHTAGLTDGLGFGDYESTETVPAIEESLRNPRTSSGASAVVAVGREPGSEFLYSGGGYLILELVIEEVTGQRFADYAQQAVLDPLGMGRSTYVYLGDLENRTPSFNRDGSVAPTYRYASNAATGLSSSAADLTELVRALTTADGLTLEPATIRAMREPYGFVFGAGIWGLGTMLYVETPDGDFVFGHDGANDPALNTTVRINPDSADGLIVLVSGHPTLASNIGSEWVLWQTGYPDFLSTGKAFESAVLPMLIGSLGILLLVLLQARRRRA